MKLRIYSILVCLGNFTHFAIRTSYFNEADCEKVYFHDLLEPVKKELKAEKIDKKILSLGYQKENDKEVHFEMNGSDVTFDTVDLLKWLLQMFPRARFGWNISLDSFDITDIVDRLYPTQSHLIKLEDGNLSSEQLCTILNRMKRLERIFIHSTVAPSFKHSEALSYKQMHYQDARWMKVEDLFFMKNPFLLSVVETSFDNADLRCYLEYWKISYDNIRGRILLYLRSGVDIDIQSITQGFPTYRGKNRAAIICDLDAWREHPILMVYFNFRDDPKKIAIKTFHKSRRPHRYEQLVLLRKLHDLKAEMKEVERRIELELAAEYDQEGQMDVLRRCRELEASLEDLNHQCTVTERQIQEVIDAHRSRRNKK